MLGLEIAVDEFKSEDQIAQSQHEGAERSSPGILPTEEKIENEESTRNVDERNHHNKEKITEAPPTCCVLENRRAPHVAEGPVAGARREAGGSAVTGTGMDASGWVGGGDGIC